MWLGSSDTTIQSEVMRYDKLLHAGAYGLLQLLMLRACHGGFTPARRAAMLTAAAASLSHGVISETLQSFIPGRTASVWDLVADIVGILIASILWLFATPRLTGSSRGR
ncbi:hypothetical protein ABI59_02960 [Acidobacteria bacterium Mor1]|nr:hypothetical protein ABI59_02960 [Acidobacteria bacterium Mor1]